MTLCASKDSRLMEAHRHNNTGLEEASIFKIGNGRDRVIVGFALDPAHLSRGIAQVRLRLAVWSNAPHTQLTRGGLDVGAYRVREHWEEGNGRWDRFYDSLPTDPRTEHVGRGVTWNCAVDRAIENGTSGSRFAECVGGKPWVGGGIDDDPATPENEKVTPTATCHHPARRLGVPLTQDACYDANAWQFTCTFGDGERARDIRSLVDFAEWDVTRDVEDALAEGRTEVSWVLRKNDSRSSRGRLRYYSKDGALYWLGKGVAGASVLAPRLLIDFAP
jgi:hypothetical protein